jgi:lipid-A-disaccharide synthase
MTLRVYLIAGEPSGDLLGSRLMRALKHKTKGQITFMGVGGETMHDEGLKFLFDIRDLAVMGLFEVIPSIPKILGHLNEIMADIQKKKPDIIMTIDSYSFSIRVHKKLKKLNLGIPHVHCVAPQVWAWKKGRAKILHKYIDHLFCLLPNEEKYFKPYGLKTTFIGHPVIEGGADKGSATAFRKKYHLKNKTKVLTLLPGSRKNEVSRLMPVFKEVCEKLSQTYPDLFVVIPSVKTVAPTVCDMVKRWHIPHTIIMGEKKRYDAFAASDVAIAASGTVSLELSLAGVPHLIAYRVHPITGWMAKKLLKIRFVNLINLLQNKEVIPELLQDNCTVEKIYQQTQKLLQNPKQNVKKSLDKLKTDVLPSDKMADVLLSFMKRNKNDK